MITFLLAGNSTFLPSTKIAVSSIDSMFAHISGTAFILPSPNMDSSFTVFILVPLINLSCLVLLIAVILVSNDFSAFVALLISDDILVSNFVSTPVTLLVSVIILSFSSPSACFALFVSVDTISFELFSTLSNLLFISLDCRLICFEFSSILPFNSV